MAIPLQRRFRVGDEIVVWRTLQGQLRVDFVEWIHNRKNVRLSIPFDKVKSKQQLECWANLWPITAKVPTEVLEV